MSKNKRLTNVLLQAQLIVESLINDIEYQENKKELLLLQECIQEALDLVENDMDENHDLFEKVLKIVELVIKVLGVEGLQDLF